MEGALIIPSEEDNYTFTINFSTGEVYRVRAVEAKERKVWVDKLRACTTKQMVRTASTRSRFLRSVMSGSSLCETLHVAAPSPVDAFNAVEDILLGLDYKQEELEKTIDSLSILSAPDNKPPTLSCHAKDLLLLKAT